jgi:hypothetical protein
VAWPATGDIAYRTKEIMAANLRWHIFTVSGIAGNNLSLRGAQRRSNPLPDERTPARQAGDCFVASLLAMTGVGCVFHAR